MRFWQVRNPPLCAEDILTTPSLPLRMPTSGAHKSEAGGCFGWALLDRATDFGFAVERDHALANSELALREKAYAHISFNGPEATRFPGDALTNDAVTRCGCAGTAVPAYEVSPRPAYVPNPIRLMRAHVRV